MRLALKSHGFRAFLGTQALGAFNDNAFRFSLIFWLEATARDAAEQGARISLAQALFALPFIVFAALAGSVADKLSKSTVIRAAKLAEIVVMGAAVLAFGAGSAGMLVAVLFLMATQSAFFGPGKYGYLAETLDTRDLARANGLVQMTTYASVVAGQIVGGLVYDAHGDDLAAGALWFVGFAVIGTLVARGVPVVPASRADGKLVWNPLPELATTWRGVRADPTLLYTILGQAHFFLLVAALQISLAVYGVEALGLDERAGAASLVAMATVGLGCGAVLAGRWSEGKVELGLVPFGALTLSLGLAALAWIGTWPLLGGALVELASPGLPGLLRAALVDGLWAPFAFSFSLGMAGGFYIVPLWALLQQRAPEKEKGRYLAFGNMVGFFGIGLAALLLWMRTAASLTWSQYFLVLSALGFAGTLVSLRLLPYAFLRLVVWLLAHSLYRIRVRHGERLPTRGGALLLVNHVSWVDALILLASTRRGMHFLMYRPYYEWWPTHWLFKLMGCIPVASGDDRASTDRSLREAGRFLDDGKLVVVFGEGAVTRLGHMLPFRTGYRRVIEGRDVPIVPVHLGGLWGSIFSHERGRLLFKWPREVPYPVSVSFGEPLSADAQPAEVRRAIQELAAGAWSDRGADAEPLHVQLVREGRRRFAPRLIPAKGPPLSVARLLARAGRAARVIGRRMAPGRRVAVLGPPGLDALTAQLAVLLGGHTPWLLETEEQLEAVRGPGGPDLVLRVGSAELDGAGGDEVPWSAVVGRSGPGETLAVLWHAVLPARGAVRRFCRGPRAAPDDTAVVLAGCRPPRSPTHAQADAQLRGLRQVLAPGPEARLLAAVSGARAYGWMVTGWLPLLHDATLAWAAPEDDGKALGQRVLRHELTWLPASPTLLRRLVDEGRPDHLGSLRLLWCGEGPLDPALARRCRDELGLDPRPLLSLDGASGVVCLNTDDVRLPGVVQRGQREGTLGHPLPGLLVDVVDAGGRALPPGRVGRLVVRGSSVQDGGVLTTRLRGRVDAEGFVSLATGGAAGGDGNERAPDAGPGDGGDTEPLPAARASDDP